MMHHICAGPANRSSSNKPNLGTRSDASSWRPWAVL